METESGPFLGAVSFGLGGSLRRNPFVGQTSHPGGGPGFAGMERRAGEIAPGKIGQSDIVGVRTGITLGCRDEKIDPAA